MDFILNNNLIAVQGLTPGEKGPVELNVTYK